MAGGRRSRRLRPPAPHVPLAPSSAPITAPFPTPRPATPFPGVPVTDLLLRPAADAFLTVGVPVAVLAAVAAWARVRYGDRMTAAVERHARLGPALGAVMGAVPGCGTAIAVVLLWVRGHVSYGTAVAALTATMGDAAFVVIAADPRLALVLHGCLLVAGVLTGYAVDGVRYDARSATRGSQERAPQDRASQGRVREDAASGGADPGGCCGPRRRRAPSPAAPRPEPAPAPAPASPTPALLREARPRRTVAWPTPALAGGVPVALPIPPVHAALWLLAAAGTLLAVPAAVPVLGAPALVPLPGVDPWLVVGVAGVLACTAVVVRSGCRFGDDGAQRPATVAAALSHGAVETAFVTTWVAAAFVAQSALTAATGFDGSALPLAGAVGVALAVAVGLLPGCGTQIAFTGLYVTGALPFPALLANAVAQDGDALLPLLALDRAAAVRTTVLTSAPALAAGLLALALV